MIDSTEYFLDNWEVRSINRTIINGSMLFFRGDLYSNDRTRLLAIAWYSTYVEKIDMACTVITRDACRVVTRDGRILRLGTPKKEFVELLKGDCVWHEGILPQELTKLLTENNNNFRYHPHMLGLCTVQPSPTKICIEATHLLIEEKSVTLAKEEQDFLASVRSCGDGSIGEFTYANNTWFYKGEKIYTDKPIPEVTPTCCWREI